jgi:hypothetical protein
MFTSREWALPHRFSKIEKLRSRNKERKKDKGDTNGKYTKCER